MPETSLLTDANLALAITWGLHFLSAILIVIVAWSLGNWSSRQIRKIKRIDETITGFFGALVKYAILTVAFITILGQFGVQTASLLAVLGAAGLAIGLALQGTLSNVAAGVMLLFLRPFRIGDTIQVGAIIGVVKELGLFGTEIATGDNIYIFVPNSQIWNNDIWNFNRYPERRQDILVAISYQSDLNKAVSVIEKILAQDKRILQSPDAYKPQVLTDALRDYSVALIVRIWSKREDHGNLRNDLTRQIKDGLENAGITVSVPVRALDLNARAA